MSLAARIGWALLGLLLGGLIGGFAGSGYGRGETVVFAALGAVILAADGAQRGEWILRAIFAIVYKTG